MGEGEGEKEQRTDAGGGGGGAAFNGGGTTEQNKARALGLGGGDGGEGVATSRTGSVLVSVPIGLESTVGRSRVQPRLRTHRNQRKADRAAAETSSLSLIGIVELICKMIPSLLQSSFWIEQGKHDDDE